MTSLPESVHFQPSDPGTRWVKDARVVIDVRDDSGMWRNLTPNVIELSGGFRMYYTESGPGPDYKTRPANILSAYSDDGEAWEREPGIRLGPHEPGAARRVVCPDVVPLPAGGYRMYLEGQPHDGPSSIISASSSDGLVWEPDPSARFGDGEWSYGSPRCLYVDAPNGEILYRLYFHRYTFPLVPGLESGNHIISALSSDGLRFEIEPGVRIGQESDLESYSVYAPEVLRLGDGTYRMYYAGWSADPIRGRIFSTVSRDGIDWTKDPEPNVVFGGRWDKEKCSEPCVMRMPDGRYRMYYEANDGTSTWRILSATAM